MRDSREVRRLRQRVAELERMLPFEGRTLRQMAKHGMFCNGQDYCGCPDAAVVAEPDAELICSDIDRDTHKPVIDIDLPCRLVESSPGKFHLYIDTQVERVAYFQMLEAMAKAGVVEDGYAFASKMRGYSAVRHPAKLKAVQR
jgi:hypothetical protein